MATSILHSASSLLLEPLPTLDTSARRTTGNALHRINFVGRLLPWTNFEAEVVNSYNGEIWNPRVLASKLTGTSLAGSVDEEHVPVSDERGVQSRLEGRARIALGVAFEAQNRDFKLGALKGALPPCPRYKKAPDFVLMTRAHIAKVVGEVKVPWIRKHCLDKLIVKFESAIKEDWFRHALG